ncbi:hypothetical protein BMS3Bbin08_02746 [bacterium BMS3Bbin08]|nr:hypothetical protein BMS3Bbin08_02746 [bacterium BMS3Bbin08]
MSPIKTFKILRKLARISGPAVRLAVGIGGAALLILAVTEKVTRRTFDQKTR